MFSKIKSERGFSVTEILVSSGIVAITALVVSQFVSQQKKLVNNVVTRNACTAYIAEVQQTLRAVGTSISINSLTGEQAMMEETGSMYMSGNTPDGLISPSIRWPTANTLLDDIAANPHTVYGANILLRTPQMYDGSIGVLVGILNSDPNFCTTYQDPSVAGSTLLPAPVGNSNAVFNMLNPVAGLQIIPYDLETGAEINCGAVPANLIIKPRGSALASVAKTGDANFPNVGWAANVKEWGLKVKIRVDYQDNMGNANRCLGELKFQYPPDIAQPVVPGGVITGIDTIPNAAANPAPLGDFSTLSTDATVRINNAGACGTANTSNIVFNFNYDASTVEPGSVIVCRDQSRMVAKTIRCEDAAGNNLGIPKPLRSAIYGGVPVAQVPTQINAPPVTPIIYHPQYVNPATTNNNFADGSWVPCNEVKICNSPGLPVVTESSSSANSNVNLTVGFNGIEEGCLARIEFAFVDTAGNISSIRQVDHIVEVAQCGAYCWDSDGVGGPVGSYYYRCGGCGP